MNWKKLYPTLVPELQSLDSDVDRLKLLQRLQIWLKGSVHKFSPEIRAAYELDEYAALDLERFPISESSLSPAEEVHQLLALPPQSMDNLAMRLRDVIWQGITVESPIECPICNYLQLRILEDPLTHEVVFACDLCAWAQTENGEEWQQDRYLKPATKEVFAGWKNRNS